MDYWRRCLKIERHDRTRNELINGSNAKTNHLNERVGILESEFWTGKPQYVEDVAGQEKGG